MQRCHHGFELGFFLTLRTDWLRSPDYSRVQENGAIEGRNKPKRFTFLSHGVETELRMKLLRGTFSNTAPRTSVSSRASIRAAGGADTLLRFCSNWSQEECVCVRVLRARSCARLFRHASICRLVCTFIVTYSISSDLVLDSIGGRPQREFAFTAAEGRS